MAKPGPCYLCGRDPAAGFASIWDREHGERWYCHGDEPEDELTCYMAHRIARHTTKTLDLRGDA